MSKYNKLGMDGHPKAEGHLTQIHLVHWLGNRISKLTMDIVTVIGTVVASQKTAALKGCKLLLVADTESYGNSTTPIVAIDTVGAGIGECVLLVRGSSARVAAGMSDMPVDAVIVGIIDEVERDGRTVYRKADRPSGIENS